MYDLFSKICGFLKSIILLKYLENEVQFWENHRKIFSIIATAFNLILILYVYLETLDIGILVVNSLKTCVDDRTSNMPNTSGGSLSDCNTSTTRSNRSC